LYRLLHSGFDKLDVAFRATIDPDTLSAARAAQEEARSAREPVLARLGPGRVEAHVAGHGMRGGYAFLLDTGPLGANVFLKDDVGADPWTVFASPSAQSLLAYGYDGAKARLLELLEALGCRVAEESLNRVDFALDYLAPDLALDPGQFVAHPRTKVRPHWSKDVEGDRNQPRSVCAGRRVESVTIGTMPGRQLILYNKRREALDRRKLFRFERWGVEPKDASQVVWRIELRAGKNELKRFGLRSFADLDASVGDVLAHAFEEVRYLAPGQTDTNVTRRRLHPLWECARADLAAAVGDLRSGLAPDQVRELERQQALATYQAQIWGNAAGFAAALGLPDDEVADALWSHLESRLHQELRDKGGAFWKSLARARRRLRFLS
jgi:hypothetical protein